MVALVTPIEYYPQTPLRVFELLILKKNLRIIRYCVKYRKRVVFRLPLKCVRYDAFFDEDKSNSIVGR